MAQALVEHFSQKGQPEAVEKAVLHMDITSLDLNQVSQLHLSAPTLPAFAACCCEQFAQPDRSSKIAGGGAWWLQSCNIEILIGSIGKLQNC